MNKQNLKHLEGKLVEASYNVCYNKLKYPKPITGRVRHLTDNEISIMIQDELEVIISYLDLVFVKQVDE